MISEAINWDSSQGKAGGSSKRAIAKYIDRVYTNLPPTHSALLTHHLKRLKNLGQLVMIKNSYQLPVRAASPVNTTASASASASASDPPRSAAPPPLDTQAPTATPKKRAGRPPKTKTEPQIVSGFSPTQPPSSAQQGGSVGVATNGPSSGKRPRGRPPKQQEQQVSEVPFVQPISQTQEAQTPTKTNYVPAAHMGFTDSQSVKRRPGRPSKKQNVTQQAQPVSQVRLEPDNKEWAVVPANGVVKKRPGRPPRANVNVAAVTPDGQVASGLKRRGRPKRSALGPAAVRPVGKKRRGRPPKIPGGGSYFVSGKRRGRPPKGSFNIQPKFMRRYTGKPLGRPRKVKLLFPS